ncbi:ABC transporter substrate-binding protein [Agrobacterium burrii]|uniref:ABC transporter substrate-binding protein n=1 Tax=Agrobacterium burrii TaxID=2815339 RepID=A0ABS3EJX4_9HYPH|nr:ABC transporter substrate-binding protein [Agrobacterium burrii]MBO0132274.1 ABC transporter substrate-binding protein [Agrobacterium burrii]
MEELEDRTGAEYVGRLDDVVRYARAFLSTDRDQLAFHLSDPSGQWLRVSLWRSSVGQKLRAAVQVCVIDPPFDLTWRELDILTLVAAGFANETIAARLEISLRTVAKHVEHMFRKTDIWTRAGLASHAVDNDLLRLPIPGGPSGYPLAIGGVHAIADHLRLATPPARTRSRALSLRPLIIGMPFASEGRGAADSAEMLNGAELAIAEANERGGVMGRPVALHAVSYRSGDEESALSAYRDLVENEVDAITAGYACYSPKVHDLVGDARIPYLHAATMRRAVERVRDSRLRLGNIFQTCASDVNYGLGLVRFIKQMRAGVERKNLSIVLPYWPGLDIGLDFVDTALGRHGWRVDVVDVKVDEPGCWERTVAELHRNDPSVIVLASFFVEDAIGFQRAFLENPLRALIYDIYSPSVPQFLAELGNRAEGVVWATTSGVYSDAIGDRFRQRYESHFHRSPGSSQAGLAYDRVGLLLGAWLRTGHPRIFKEVLHDLRTTISRGVNGAYYLGNEGQVGLAFPDDTRDHSISQAHLVFQVQNGRNTIIAPDVYAHGRFRLPPWF